MEKYIEDIIVDSETPAIIKVIKEKMDVVGNYPKVKKEFYSLLKYYTGKKPEDFASYVFNNINKQILEICQSKNVEYTLSFNTAKYSPKLRKNWELRLKDDTICKLNGITWRYKTITGLENRFEEIQGHTITNNSACFYLTDYSVNGYGKQRVEKALPGICTGYISWVSVWDKLELSPVKKILIPFTHFYDIRALSKTIDLKNCFVVIEKIIQ